MRAPPHVAIAIRASTNGGRPPAWRRCSDRIAPRMWSVTSPVRRRSSTARDDSRRGPAFHRDPQRRARRLGALSRRLHHRLEVAAGLCDEVERRASVGVPDSVQPPAVDLVELLESGGCTRLAPRRHRAVSRGAGSRGLPEHLRPLSHEPVEVSDQRGRRCSDVSRRRHQLRDVPRSVATARRAHEGTSFGGLDQRCRRGYARQLQTPLGGAIGGDLRAVSRAIGDPRRATRRRGELL